MNTLVICTSFRQSLCGCVKDGKLVASYKSSPHLRSSQEIFSHLQELFNSSPLNNMDLIVCGVGPGSFTGIRVAASIAQAFSYSLKIPLVGVSSLQAHLPALRQPFYNLMSANAPGVYAMKAIPSFEDKKSIVKWQPPELWSWSHCFKTLGKECLFAFEKESFVKKARQDLQSLQGVEPSLLALYRQGLLAFERGEFTLGGTLELQYLRPSQAEIQKQGNEKEAFI